MQQTGGRTVLQGVFSLFGTAWRRAATVQTAQADFREKSNKKIPVNPIAIHHVYEQSLTTKRPLQPEGRALQPEQVKLPEIPDWIGAQVAIGEDATDRPRRSVCSFYQF